MRGLPDDEDWDADEVELYSKVYDFLMANQALSCHPKMPTPKPEHWETICHNAAMLATTCMGGGNLSIKVDDEIVATTEYPGMTH